MKLFLVDADEQRRTDERITVIGGILTHTRKEQLFQEQHSE